MNHRYLLVGQQNKEFNLNLHRLGFFCARVYIDTGINELSNEKKKRVVKIEYENDLNLGGIR